jgi:hypothetical protein
MARPRLGAFVVVALLPSAALAASEAARADEPSVAPARVTQLTWVPLSTTQPAGGEPTSDDSLAPAIAVLPLRLSLVGSVFPVEHAFGDDSCAQSAAASGNTVWGFPVQSQTYFALTPRLAVHGFSRLGCPLDAGVGWGITYAAPIAPRWWVVGGLGAYGLASALPGRPLVSTDARVDLVYRPSPDRAWAVGLGKRGVSLSGIW